MNCRCMGACAHFSLCVRRTNFVHLPRLVLWIRDAKSIFINETFVVSFVHRNIWLRRTKINVYLDYWRRKILIKTAWLTGCSFLQIFPKLGEQYEESKRLLLQWKWNTPLNRFVGPNNFHSYFFTLYAHMFWKKLSSANTFLRVKATLTYMPSIHVDLLNEKARRIVIALLNMVLNWRRRKSYIGKWNKKPPLYYKIRSVLNILP